MPILANAIPKSGTHLLCRALDLLGLGRDGTVKFVPASGDRFPERICYDRHGLFDFGKDQVPLAAATVRLVSKDRFAGMVQRFSTLGSLEYCDAHLAWSETAGELLARAGVKVILIMREPRAVARSHVDWIAGEQISHLHKELFLPLSLRERLSYEFFGVPAQQQSN